ncbi:TLR cluster1 member 19 [Biomphalaria glabrata]|nr:toll-like receptor 4 [Biomphalaria glabrata]
MATFLEVLALFVCTIQCSYIASNSRNDHHNGTQKEEEITSRETILYRNQGTWEQHEEVHRKKSRINSLNSIVENNSSVSVDSMCTAYSLTVDCSNLNLQVIYSSWFPNSTEIIFLNHNLLIKLTNSTFSHLIHLKHLDLSDNDISEIHLLAFDGLTSLRFLRLNYNYISFNAVSPYIFEPLNNLQSLDLIQRPRAEKVDVPGLMLQPLTQLRSLALCTFSSTLYFGPEFLNLTHLEVLEITGSTQYITEASFKNVNGLKELVISGMSLLKSMDDKVFVHFKNLTVLKMFYTVIDLQRVLSLLWPFTGRAMSEILFRGITATLEMPDPMRNGYLTKKDLMYVTDICLHTFTMIQCNIYYVTTDAFINSTTWDRCLRNILISGNPIIGSAIALFPLALLQNLTTAVVGNAMRTCQSFSPFPRFSLTKDNYLRNYYYNELLFHGKWTSQKGITVTEAKLFSREINNLTKKTLDILNGTINIYVSKYLNSWVSQRLMPDLSLENNVTFRGADNLQYTDISDSGYHTFTGHVHGLSSLKTAIVSGNDVSVLSDYFLDSFFGLENLAVSKCQLDRIFFAIKSDRVFENTTKLKELDLSENSLNAFSKGTFARNSELVYLSLSGNQFKDIPFDLKFTPNLKILDLSNNVITTLTPDSTMALDVLHSRNGGLKFMLNGNILSCGCHDLSFLQWLNSTSVSLDNNRNYTCMNKDGERTNTLAFSDLESLWRQCWGEFFFYIALITLCLYVTGAVLIFLMLRNKNFLVSYFLQIFGNFKLHTRFDYKTDVYIGYSDEDYRFPCIELREHLEQKLKLNTFIIDRDLLASLDKASGIVDAINSCWRVLLVCSKSFLKDEDWSMFTMRSAMYAQSPANPARIVIMVQKSCFSLLPMELLSAVNDGNIIIVPEWKINYTISEKLRTRLMA